MSDPNSPWSRGAPSPAEPPSTLPIVVRMAAYESQDEGKMFRVSESHNHVLREVPIEGLREGLARICAGVEAALSKLPTEGRFPLREVCFKVVVDARGEVAILAAGGEDGELTLRFGAD